MTEEQKNISWKHLEVEEPELADEIRKKMFVFEDILSLDDRAIQRVLRDVDNSDLALALKGATEEVQNVILKQPFKTSCCYDKGRYGIYGTCSYEGC